MTVAPPRTARSPAPAGDQPERAARARTLVGWAGLLTLALAVSLVAGGATTMAAVMATMTSPMANSATIALRRAPTWRPSVEASSKRSSRRSPTRRRLALASSSMAASTTTLTARYRPWSASNRLAGLPTSRQLWISPVATSTATLIAAIREKLRTAGSMTSGAVRGITIHPTIASPAIQVAAAA